MREKWIRTPMTKIRLAFEDGVGHVVVAWVMGGVSGVLFLVHLLV